VPAILRPFPPGSSLVIHFSRGTTLFRSGADVHDIIAPDEDLAKLPREITVNELLRLAQLRERERDGANQGWSVRRDECNVKV
jgi:hypothetical protein